MKKQFKKIYIEIINQCNLSCSFCPPGKRQARCMSCDEFEHILESIKPFTDYIYLHVKGEPLLHPDLKKLLKLAGDYGFYVNMTTNGTLLASKKNMLLNSHIRQMNISLHSFAANAFLPEHMSFDDYIDHAIDFARDFAKHQGITAFRLWNLDSDLIPVQEKKQNDYIIRRLCEAFDFKGDTDPSLYRTSDLPLSKNIYLSFDSRFQWPSLDADDFGACGTCMGLKSHAAILCDGTVIPCCLDGDGIISLGNVFYESFADIIKAPKSMELLRSFQNHHIEEPLCRRCGYRTRF